MRITWKATVVPATIILLIFFCFIAPAVISTQASSDLSQVLQGSQGPFILKAIRIDGTNAHLQLQPDPLYPVFTFSSATIRGLQIIAHATDGQTLRITASGPARSTRVAIKTAIGYEIASALQSFNNPADLLILAAGGTVPHLTMTNVTLVIDHYLTSATFVASGLRVALTTATMTMPSPARLSLAQVVATLTPTPKVGSCATSTTVLSNAGNCATPTPTAGTSVGVTPTLPPVSTSLPAGAATPSSASGTMPGPTPSPTPGSSGSNQNNNKSFWCRVFKIGC